MNEIPNGKVKKHANFNKMNQINIQLDCKMTTFTKRLCVSMLQTFPTYKSSRKKNVVINHAWKSVAEITWTPYRVTDSAGIK